MADTLAVRLEDILEFGIDFVKTSYRIEDGKEIEDKYEIKRITCKTLEEARRRADAASRIRSNSFKASVSIKIKMEKKKLFSKDTKIVDKWVVLEKYYDGRLDSKSKDIVLVEPEKPTVDIWA